MHLLNADPRLALGRERFKKVVPAPADFEPDRFLDPVADETNLTDPSHYEVLAERVRGGSLAYIGDKTPGYYKKLPRLLAAFPDARFLITYRDPLRVASSFEGRARRPSKGWPAQKNHQEGIEQWRASLERWRHFSERYPAARVLPIKYEWFYCGDLRYLRVLYEFLGLSLSSAVYDAYFETVTQWNRLRKKELVLDEGQVEAVRNQTDGSLLDWADREALRAILRVKNGDVPEAHRKRFHRFLRFVVHARNEQLRVATGGMQAAASPTESLARDLSRIHDGAGRLGDRIHARERSLWWRSGRWLQRLFRGGRKNDGKELARLAQRIESIAARAHERLTVGTNDKPRS